MARNARAPRVAAPRPAPARARSGRRAVEAPTLARLTSWAPGEPLQVTVDRPGARPQTAESVVPLGGAQLRALVETQARVLVTFVDGDAARPVVVGVLQALPTTVELDLPVGEVDHAQVDGRRVTLTGRDEIELKCGQASITLRRNGRLVMRGTAVETASTGVNRIKGGTVRIN